MYITILLLIIQSAFINLPLNESNQVEYVEVKEIEKSKAEIFVLCKEWVSDNFKSSKEVLEIEDKEAGILVGKGVHIFSASRGGITFQVANDFKFKIEIKENKYRVIFNNITYTGVPSNGQYLTIEKTYSQYKKDFEKGKYDKKPSGSAKVRELYLKESDTTIKALINSLEKKVSKKDDW